MTYEIATSNRIADIQADTWDSCIGPRPFADSRWFRFLEAALPDARPWYLVVYQDDLPVAAATCWARRHTYIPFIESPTLKHLGQRFLQQWPLLSCETPLTEQEGFFFAESDPPRALVQALTTRLRDLAWSQGAAFLGFDYLAPSMAAQLEDAVPDLIRTELPQDTYLDLTWDTFADYVADLSYRKRKNVRRELRLADKRGYSIEVWDEFAERRALLYDLVVRVHRQHGEQRIPFGPEIYVQAKALQPKARVIAICHQGRPVACELLFRDQGALLPKLVGLDYDHTPFVYALLAYGEIRHAIESGARRIHMGSTNYDFKRRLGCQLIPKAYGLLVRPRWLRTGLRRWLA
jgi:predicted N-acyltransferase